MKMRQKWFGICGSVTLGAGLLLAGCGTPSNSYVRAVNASPGLTNYTVQVGETPVVSSLPYGTEGVVQQGTYGAADTSGNYRPVGAGAKQSILVYQQSASSPLASQSQTLLQNSYYTIVTINPAPGTGLLTLTDDDSAPQGGGFKLRVVQTSSSAGAVDVYVTALAGPNGVIPAANTLTPALSNFTFGQVTQTYFALSPGTYAVQITPHGNPNTVLVQTAFTPVAGHIYTVFALDPPAGGAGKFGLLVTNDPVAATTASSSKT
jgi:hypothetical protein